ncbi:MAG: RagB/SusD family nutrient uptake outer membrane protein [Bacteroidales bacterium]|nr:RagB/SusD family nutrient uptake outer membrane protein [Bacteroidales bacterium]
MKDNRYRGIALLSVIAAMSMMSCSDEFLQDKRNYDNVSTEIYNNIDGANGRVNDLYSWCLPNPNTGSAWNNNSTGLPDEESKSTEEYAGFGGFVNPDSEYDAMNGTIVPDFFRNQSNNIQQSVWGRIRNINDVITGISNGTLDQKDKDVLLGQAYFFRAWCYYQLVRWYGGVPIVKEVQLPDEGSFVPRSSARECIEFILSDLETSARMLDGKSYSSDGYGRITKSAALALRGRVLLLWASPVMNRANDQSRWNNAYNTMKADLDAITAEGHGLYTGAGVTNAASFAGVFSQYQSNEAIFVTLFNTVKTGDGQKNNTWENSIRPRNTSGSGGKAPSSMILNQFPMKDGKKPSTVETYSKLEASAIEYDAEYPFMNRDPRFYRTFAFPGFRWAFTGDARTGNVDNPDYNSGEDYELWNYVWYVDKSDAGNVESGNSYGADNLLTSKQGVYVRKRTDDKDISGALYSYDASTDGKAFQFSGAPYIEIRYAECLLNFAEAACGAGHMDEAVEQLRKLRERVGYTGENNYGLSAGIEGDQAACMSAVLYERMIELAYEGKRFEDLRRWMLFDGGANMSEVEGCPSTWKLTGWNGNTCEWLGFKPMNGQRRETIQYRTADKYGVPKDYGMSGTTMDSDPLVLSFKKSNEAYKSVDYYTAAKASRCDAVDLRKPLDSQLETLKAWYQDNLAFKENKGDARDNNHDDEYMHYFAKYYFLGFNQGTMSDNTRLLQTIGWKDSNNGGANGTFDPLAN